MSKLQLSPNPSGAGIVTLAAPNTASDVTLTLPAVTAELITNSSGVLNIGSGQLVKDVNGNFGIGSGTTSGIRLAIRTATTTDAAFVADNTINSGFRVQFANNLTSIGNDFNNPLAFLTNNTERMRIDSAGNLLVGTTSQLPASTSRAVFTQGTADYTVRIDNSSVEPYGVSFTYSAASPNSTGSAFIYCSDSGSSQRFSVRSNGGVHNYSGNNVNLSDRREKTNFAPAKSYLDVICAIPVQTFNYIDQNNEEDPGLTLGVVAQDVQAVAPEFVMESNWGTKDEPKMRLSIYQTDLQYALMKCIQEQQALIQDLTTRLTTLEGN
jgi:hypothetical protein